MPSLGADMEVGTILEWRVQPGDTVHRGDIIAVVDTEKSDVEVEVFEDGVVEELLVETGVEVPVGTPLARLTTTGAPPAAPGFVPASPRARRAAAEQGVDLAGVVGSGPGGAVVTADLGAPPAAAGPTEPPSPPVAERPEPVPATTESAPADRDEAMRHAIGALMARSKREIPHYYLATTIDLSRSLDWLAQENAERPVTERLLPAALLLKATARAAREVPVVNGFFEEGFRPASAVHLGVAVSLRGGGLVAPAIHDADGLDLLALMQALRDLVNRARAGVLRGSEMTDPTITVTNLGDQGVDEVFGVIYPPQVALVGFGRIGEQPVAVDGMLAVRPVVRATLAADHRASEGHEGARFLSLVDTLLQEPEAL
jgi:pyruvate dehydrogenase E2 component (dihydrolipoamide acetyltransferase)